MLYSSAASLLLAGLAAAAPTLIPAALEARSTKVDYEYLNVTYSSSSSSGRNASLPNVLILATGGTIAGASSSSSDATHYEAGVVGIAALVQAVPSLLNVSNIDGIQFSNVNSGDITTANVLQLSKVINYALCSPNSTYDGAVTLEETAFTLDITVNCEKPVVIVGAMRPSTAISADGPGNLLEAVTVAVNPRARGRGALIVLNDRIGQAWYTIKRDADVLDTFGAPQQGYVGQLLSFEPLWYYPASQPSFKRTFDVSYVEELPMVEVIYCHESYDVKLIQHAIDDGAKGIILAGTGSGDTSSAADPYIANATAAGIPIVISTKINVGVEVPDFGSDSIAAGLLNPVKARIQLQYALANGLNMTEIRDVFEGVLADMIGYGTSG